MKRILTFLTATVLLGNLILGALPAYADEPETAADTSIHLDNVDTSNSFNVGQILSVNDNQGDADDNEQSQAYLNDDAPVITFILDIVNFITRIIGAVAMLLIIVGGFMMIVSQGEEHLLQKGKDTLITAIFGLGIAMFSYIIVRFVQSLFYLAGS